MNVERPGGFLRAQFPSVISISGASQKYLDSVRVIENHQLLTGVDQAEFCELALRIATQCQHSSDEELVAVAEDILSSYSKDSIQNLADYSNFDFLDRQFKSAAKKTAMYGELEENKPTKRKLKDEDGEVKTVKKH